MSDEAKESQVINGRTGLFLKALKEIQPGALITLVGFGVALLFHINEKQNLQDSMLMVIQRDVGALTMRVNAENETMVDASVHMEQINSIHYRIGLLSDRLGKLEDD